MRRFKAAIFKLFFAPGFLFTALPVMADKVIDAAKAGALAEQTENAGSAPALIGTLQYGLAALAFSPVSYFNNGTALAMTVIIGTCGSAALPALNLLFGAKKEREFTVSEEQVAFG